MSRDVRLDALKLKINGDASGLMVALKSAHNQMLSFEHSAGAVNAAMRRMALAFAAGVGGSIKLALDFDRALVRSNMTLNASQEVMAGVHDDMLELTTKTTHSSTQLAQSLEYLGQAGLSLEQIMDNGRYTVVKFVSAFARAGNFELKTATDLLTDAATSMKGVVGLSASGDIIEDMYIIGDALSKMGSATNTSVSQLAHALTNKAGPAARMFNISLEDTITLLGVYAKQGKKGAAAGSLLEQTMRYLTASYAKNQAAYEKVNINPWDADTNQFKMLDFIKSINREMDKFGTVAGKYRFLTEDLGMSAKTMMGVFPLIDMAGEFEDLIEKAEKAADVQERLNKFVNSASGIWQIFLNHMQKVGIEIGEVFLPAFKAVMVAAVELSKAISLLLENPFFRWLLKLTTAALGLTMAVHGLSIAWQAMTIMASWWGVVGKKLFVDTGVNAGATNILTASLKRLSAALKEVAFSQDTNSISMRISATVSQAYGASVAWLSWTLKRAHIELQHHSNNLKNSTTLTKAAETATRWYASATSSLGKAWRSSKDGLTSFTEGFRVNKAVTWATDAATKAYAWTVGHLSKFLKTVKTDFMTLTEGTRLNSIATNINRSVTKAYTRTVAYLRKALKKAREGLATLTQEFRSNAVVTRISESASKAYAWTTEHLSKASNRLKTYLSSLTLQQSANNAITRISESASKAYAWTSEHLSKVLKTVKTNVKFVTQALRNSSVVTWVTDEATKAYAWTSEHLSKVLKTLKKDVMFLTQGLRANSVVTWVTDAATKAYAWTSEHLSKVLKMVKSELGLLTQGTRTNAAVTWVTESVTKAYAWTTGFLSDMFTKATAKIQTWTGSTAVNAKVTKMTGWVTGFWTKMTKKHTASTVVATTAVEVFTWASFKSAVANKTAGAATFLWAKAIDVLKWSIAKLILPLLAVYALVELMSWAFGSLNMEDFDMELEDAERMEEMMDSMQEAFDDRTFQINVDPVMSSRRLEDSYIQSIMSMANPVKANENNARQMRQFYKNEVAAVQKEVSKLKGKKYTGLDGVERDHALGAPMNKDKVDNLELRLKNAQKGLEESGGTEKELAATREAIKELTKAIMEEKQGWNEQYGKDKPRRKITIPLITGGSISF